MTYTVTRESFETLALQWEAKLSFCDTDSLFLAPMWQRLWWSAFGKEDLLLLAFHQGETLLGIAPLIQKDGQVSLLGQKEFFDYMDFISPRDTREAFLSSFIDFMVSEGWHTLSVPSIPGWSPTLALLPEIARSRGLHVEIKDEDTAPGLKLPPTWDEYLSSLSKKDRHELRRKFRRLNESVQWRHYICSDISSLLLCAEDFFHLMRESREEKDRFLTQEREDFMLSAVERLTKENIARLYFLEVNGARVASAMCFDYKGTRFLYNSGFDPSLSHLSVGLLLKALCIKEAIEQKLVFFDFLRGNEPYKYHLGGLDRPIYELTVSRG